MARRELARLWKLVRLPTRDWALLARAIGELLLARLRHAATPTRVILSQLQGKSVGRRPSKAAEVDVQRLSWAIGAAAARVPWRSDCLLQAMAADRWLRRCGYKPQFYLGVTKRRSGPLEAHAWLSCNGIPVTGGTGGGFAELLTPADAPGSVAADRGAA
jgi:hypothetical protein